MALDLTAEWDKLDNGSGLHHRRRRGPAGRGGGQSRRRWTDFLQNYAASVDWVNANTADAAAADRGVRHHRGRPCGGEGPALLQHRLHHRQRDEGQALRLSAGAGRRGALPPWAALMPGDDFYYGAIKTENPRRQSDTWRISEFTIDKERRLWTGKQTVRLWAVLFWLAGLAGRGHGAGSGLSPRRAAAGLARCMCCCGWWQLAGTAAFWRTVAWSAIRIFGGFLLATVLAVGAGGPGGLDNRGSGS